MAGAELVCCFSWAQGAVIVGGVFVYAAALVLGDKMRRKWGENPKWWQK